MQQQLHHYSLARLLTKKYSHSTYLASPIGEPERQVVLIIFTASLLPLPRDREKLLQKAQRLKELHHPHLVPLLDIGIEEEEPFVVREYLPTESLRSYLKKHAADHLALQEALSIVLQVGQALVSAHKLGIFHGNVKPENIFLDANGQASLTDFPLINRTDIVIRDQVTEGYAFCYMAPEQFAGICDARSDQYALGCLAYELITGRTPFVAQSLASMMGQPIYVPPPPLTESVADLPPSLEAATLKALSKDPSERFSDCSLFLDVLGLMMPPLPPAFPFAVSDSSHEQRTSSRLAALLLKDAIFTDNRENEASEPSLKEQDDNEISSLKLEIEPLLDLLNSELASTAQPLEPERESIVFTHLSEEEQTAQPLEPERESIVFTHPLEAEQGEKLQERAPTSSADGYRASQAGKTTSSPTIPSSKSETRASRILNKKKRKLLVFALVSSTILILALSAFWSGGILIPNIRPSLHSSKTPLIASSPSLLINISAHFKATATAMAQNNINATTIVQNSLTPTATAQDNINGTAIVQNSLTATAIAQNNLNATATATASPQTPTQLSPPDGSVFNNYPRTTKLQWSSATKAFSYTVEIDCYECCASGKWCADVGQTWDLEQNIKQETYTFDFVGAQPGRWRVQAVNASGQQSPMSGWWQFTYTV